MTGKDELIRQTKLAFDFIQKLYIEVSYLIKEIEGLLLEEEEKFIICRPSGYGITARSSTGLESVNVNMWLLRKLAVSFVPETQTKLERGQTFTEINEDLRVLYLKIMLDDNNIEQPLIYSGILFNILKKPQGERWIKKFENLMGHIEYNEQKIFYNPDDIDYEDVHIKFKGKLIKNNLYDINDSETLYDKIIVPSLKLFRE
ncbi:MAG: hypothetical protein AB1796_02560 [Bacillota bacterium]